MTAEAIRRENAVQAVTRRLKSPAQQAYVRYVHQCLAQRERLGLSQADAERVERKIAAVYDLSGSFRPTRHRPRPIAEVAGTSEGAR